jgi:hypothetical protein
MTWSPSWTLKHLDKTGKILYTKRRRVKSSPRNQFVINKARTQDSGFLFFAFIYEIIEHIFGNFGYSHTHS